MKFAIVWALIEVSTMNIYEVTAFWKRWKCLWKKKKFPKPNGSERVKGSNLPVFGWDRVVLRVSSSEVLIDICVQWIPFPIPWAGVPKIRFSVSGIFYHRVYGCSVLNGNTLDICCFLQFLKTKIKIWGQLNLLIELATGK